MKANRNRSHSDGQTELIRPETRNVAVTIWMINAAATKIPDAHCNGNP